MGIQISDIFSKQRRISNLYSESKSSHSKLDPSCSYVHHGFQINLSNITNVFLKSISSPNPSKLVLWIQTKLKYRVVRMVVENLSASNQFQLNLIRPSCPPISNHPSATKPIPNSMSNGLLVVQLNPNPISDGLLVVHQSQTIHRQPNQSQTRPSWLPNQYLLKTTISTYSIRRSKSISNSNSKCRSNSPRHPIPNPTATNSNLGIKPQLILQSAFLSL